jgi:hypothetical protein
MIKKMRITLLILIAIDPIIISTPNFKREPPASAMESSMILPRSIIFSIILVCRKAHHPHHTPLNRNSNRIKTLKKGLGSGTVDKTW